MVAKDIFPFATMIDGFKKVNIMEFFNKIHIFCEIFKEVVSKMPNSWENPMKVATSQPPVTVAKRKISFATMTHGCKGYFSFATVTGSCKEASFMGFSHYICEYELTSENMYFHMNLAKKSHFDFSFFKVDSKNPKISLEYLKPFRNKRIVINKSFQSIIRVFLFQ